MKITSVEASGHSRSNVPKTTEAQSHYFGYVGFAFSPIK